MESKQWKRSIWYHISATTIQVKGFCQQVMSQLTAVLASSRTVQIKHLSLLLPTQVQHSPQILLSFMACKSFTVLHFFLIPTCLDLIHQPRAVQTGGSLDEISRLWQWFLKACILRVCQRNHLNLWALLIDPFSMSMMTMISAYHWIVPYAHQVNRVRPRLDKWPFSTSSKVPTLTWHCFCCC